MGSKIQRGLEKKSVSDRSMPGFYTLSEHSRFKIPLRTAARTSARSFSPPTILFLAPVLSVPELPKRSGSRTGTLAASIEFRSKRGNPVPPPCALGSGFTLTSSRSASTVIMDTAVCVVSGWIGSAAGAPMIDFGRKSPTRDRVPFFMPRPIFRIIIEADDAVDEMERLSVDPWKNLPPA